MVPWPSGDFVSVSVGTNHACGVKIDGSVTCRAYRGYSELPPPSGEYASVSLGSVGWFSACGLKKDGTVACWGSDEYGQSTPPPGGFVSIGAGDRHTCGVRTDGTVACWGSDYKGQSTPSLDQQALTVTPPPSPPFSPRAIINLPDTRRGSRARRSPRRRGPAGLLHRRPRHAPSAP